MSKSKIFPSLVLGSICLVVAALLALVNSITAPKIQSNKDKQAEAALVEVLPENSNFIDVEIPEGFPLSIDLVKKSEQGGYVFRAVVTGKSAGMTVMIGIDSEGKIAGTKCTSHTETPSYSKPVFEKTESGYYVGMTESSFDAFIKAGSTLTSSAYASAVEDALRAFSILTGGEAE